jgi:hypothetical protein
MSIVIWKEDEIARILVMDDEEPNIRRTSFPYRDFRWMV